MNYLIPILFVAGFVAKLYDIELSWILWAAPAGYGCGVALAEIEEAWRDRQRRRAARKSSYHGHVPPRPIPKPRQL